LIGRAKNSLIVLKVKAAINKPLIVNYLQMADIAFWLRLLLMLVQMLTAINTLKVMIDLKLCVTTKKGGLRAAVKCNCCYDIRIMSSIIGCGGVTNWRDAVEHLAGASAVRYFGTT
jgi:dihydroorotate dehydrogenase